MALVEDGAFRYTWFVPDNWESALQRWRTAGLIDAAAGERIREFEGAQARPPGMRWPILIACAMGALLLGAGVLLFVSAHWDKLSPGQRMSLVLVMVAAFHAGGIAVSRRFESLAVALHAVGTIALGAGIALAGQIFNLNEHWPSAILLWTVGAVLGWALLGHWTQAVLVAILAPYWLAAEWMMRMAELRYSLPIAAGVCALSFTYLSARHGSGDSALRKALCWLGALALLPAAVFTAADSWTNLPPAADLWIAWSAAMLLPLAVAFLMRGREAFGTRWPSLGRSCCRRSARVIPTASWSMCGSLAGRWVWPPGAFAMPAPSASIWASRVSRSPCWRFIFPA